VRFVADSRALRQALVDHLREHGQLRTPRICAAFAAVPRELFVPSVALEDAYHSSEAILVKRIDGVGVSSASAPDVMACMLEQLLPRTGHKVLEIGAGTGYNAALLAHLVGDSGLVVSLDIDADLVADARDHLSSAGYPNVRVEQGDGALGFASQAPYDRIMLTAASRDIAPAWREQLAPDGRLLLPLGVRGVQRCVAFERTEDALESVSTGPCSFIPLRGALSMDSARLPLDAQGAVLLGLPDDATPVEPGQVLDWLFEATPPRGTDVFARAQEVRGSLQLWLATHDARVCSIWGEGSISVVPELLGHSERVRATLGFLEHTGLAILDWGQRGERGAELCVRASRNAGALAAQLIDHIRAWDAVGRPGDNALYIRAYLRPTVVEPAAGEKAIDQRWSRLILGWRAQPPASLTV
jgi:protein-L-isoaspartate(D-aspartate) O-methyltransferase